MWSYLLAGFIGMCLGAYIMTFAKGMTHDSMVEEFCSKCIRCKKKMYDALEVIACGIGKENDVKGKNGDVKWIDAHGL